MLCPPVLWSVEGFGAGRVVLGCPVGSRYPRYPVGGSCEDQCHYSWLAFHQKDLPVGKGEGRESFGAPADLALECCLVSRVQKLFVCTSLAAGHSQGTGVCQFDRLKTGFLFA